MSADDGHEAEQLAEGALFQADIRDRRAEESAVELLDRRAGIDATEFDSEQELLDARLAKRRAEEPETDAKPGTTLYRHRQRQQRDGVDGESKEQLGAQGSTGSQPSPGGGGRRGPDPDGVDSEQLARSVLGAADVLDANEGEAPSEVLERRYGVDASEFSYEQELLAAVEPKRADGAASRGTRRRTGSGGRTPSRTVSSGGGGGGDRGGEAFESEADQLAQAVLGAEDILDADDDESPSEILERRHGLDASAFASEKELRRKKRESDGTDHGGSVELR